MQHTHHSFIYIGAGAHYTAETPTAGQHLPRRLRCLCGEGGVRTGSQRVGTDAVGKSYPAVEESSHAVEENSHGIYFGRGGGREKRDAT